MIHLTKMQSCTRATCICPVVFKGHAQCSRKQIMQLLLTTQQQCNAYKTNPCDANEIALTKSTESLISCHANAPGSQIAAQIITKHKDFVNFMSVLTIVLHIQSHKDDVDGFLENELGKQILVVILFVFIAHGFNNTTMYQFVKYQGIESIGYILSSLYESDILASFFLQKHRTLANVIAILSTIHMPVEYADSSRNMIYTVCMPHLTRMLQGFAYNARLTGRAYLEDKNHGTLKQRNHVFMDTFQREMYLVHSTVCGMWKQSFDRSGENYKLDILLKTLLQSSQTILESNFQPFANGTMHILLEMVKDNTPSRTKIVKLSSLSDGIIENTNVTENIPFCFFVFFKCKMSDGCDCFLCCVHVHVAV